MSTELGLDPNDPLNLLLHNSAQTDDSSTDGSETSGPISGVRIWSNSKEQEESGLDTGLCWTIPEPFDTNIPRYMDLVYGTTAME